MSSLETDVQLVLDEVTNLSEASRVHKERLARQMRCTVAQWATLTAAGRGETVPRMARRLGLTRQSVQRTADALVSASLARYEANPHHRRSPLLVPTAEGERLLARLGEAYERSSTSVGDTLDTEELQTTLLVLRALRDELERA